MNAKNRYGAYTALQRTGCYFQNGQITNSEVHVVYGFLLRQIVDLAPWPEIEQMR